MSSNTWNCKREFMSYTKSSLRGLDTALDILNEMIDGCEHEDEIAEINLKCQRRRLISIIEDLRKTRESVCEA